jgi:hypothetical protein
VVQRDRRFEERAKERSRTPPHKARLGGRHG